MHLRGGLAEKERLRLWQHVMNDDDSPARRAARMRWCGRWTI